MGKLYQLATWSLGDKGNDGVLCVKDRRGWIQEALSMRADDRCDTRILWWHTTGAHEWSVNVAWRGGRPDWNTHKHSTHISPHTRSRLESLQHVCTAWSADTHKYAAAGSPQRVCDCNSLGFRISYARCQLGVSLCVCVRKWWYVCILARAAVVTPCHCFGLTHHHHYGRISHPTCWGAHHGQSHIHGKLNLSDTLGWFVAWHWGSTAPTGLCHKLKKQAEDVCYNRPKYWSVRWVYDGEK